MSLLLHLASRAAPVVDLEAEMDHRLQDMASRYMFATNAEMNTGLDREMADLGVGIGKNAARRQERGEPAPGGQGIELGPRPEAARARAHAAWTDSTSRVRRKEAPGCPRDC